MQARLAMINFPVPSTQAARSFYEKLLGIELARSLTEQRPGSLHAPVANGVQMLVNQRLKANEGPTPYFAVADLNGTIGALTGAGGQVVIGPTPLPLHSKVKSGGGLIDISCNSATTALPQNMGVFSLIRSPDGNLIGVIQLDPGAERFFPSHVPDAQLEDHQQGIAYAGVVLGPA